MDVLCPACPANKRQDLCVGHRLLKSAKAMCQKATFAIEEAAITQNVFGQ